MEESWLHMQFAKASSYPRPFNYRFYTAPYFAPYSLPGLQMPEKKSFFSALHLFTFTDSSGYLHGSTKSLEYLEDYVHG